MNSKYRISVLTAIPLVWINILNGQWIRQNSGSIATFSDVVLLDSTTAIVVGRDGSILKTTNSGMTWRNTAPQLDCKPESVDCFMRWNAISFCDSLHGIVVGDLKILLTTDGGEGWEFCSLSGPQRFLSAFYWMSNLIYVGDDSGRVFQSIDSGKTWKSNKISDQAILSLFFYAAPIMSWRSMNALSPFSVYSEKSSGFDSWYEERLPITTWGSVTRGSSFKWGDPAFVVGYDGQLLERPVIFKKSFPDTSWQRYYFNSASWGTVSIGRLNDVTVPASNISYICGDDGVVLKTIDSGKTWISQQTGTGRNLRVIDYYNENYGIAVGDSGIILYTSNGGEETLDVKENDREPYIFTLAQNYPNPFNPITTIAFNIPFKSFVSLTVFNLLGREMATLVSGELLPGKHKKQWNAEGISSGVYFYRLSAVPSISPGVGPTDRRDGHPINFTDTKKLILLR